jgi:hypothetical protein
VLDQDLTSSARGSPGKRLEERRRFRASFDHDATRDPTDAPRGTGRGCDSLHGKEGVDGSSPSEGSRKKARKGGSFAYSLHCTSSNTPRYGTDFGTARLKSHRFRCLARHRRHQRHRVSRRQPSPTAGRPVQLPVLSASTELRASGSLAMQGIGAAGSDRCPSLDEPKERKASCYKLGSGSPRRPASQTQPPTVHL